MKDKEMEIKIKKLNEMTADDIEERKLQLQEKVVKIASEVGETVKEVRKTTKIGRYYLYLIILIIVVVYIFFLGYGIYQQGGFKKFADNALYSEGKQRRFTCWNDEYNVTFHSMSEAINFQNDKLFGNMSCEYWVET